MSELNVSVYHEILTRCGQCQGKGCSKCGKKGFKQKPLCQIEGVEYSIIEEDIKEIK